MKYRKKPVVQEVFEAFLFDGTDECLNKVDWIMAALITGEVARNSRGLIMTTPKGMISEKAIMYASPGDYVMLDVYGQILPCQADIFETTYEPVGINIPTIRILE